MEKGGVEKSCNRTFVVYVKVDLIEMLLFLFCSLWMVVFFGLSM